MVRVLSLDGGGIIAQHSVWVQVFWNDDKSRGYSEKLREPRVLHGGYGLRTLLLP
jgi:hypothetical protein